MQKIIVSLGLVVLLACAYKPEVRIPVEASVPSDFLSNAVTAALHPASPDTCQSDSFWIAQINAVKASKVEEAAHNDHRANVTFLRVGLHALVVGILLLR